MTAARRALVVGASETAALLHLPQLARLRDAGRIELVEICDLRLDSATAARDRFGFTRAGSDAATAIARDDIDLVYLFGSARMHFALGLAALDAGKHLFVEKPIAPTYAEAAELAEAAADRGLVAVCGHNRRFLAAFEHIRAARGSVGWASAEALFHKPELGRPAPFGASTWLTANGIHALDALLFMMGGLPESLTARATGTGRPPAVFSAMMTWASGATGVLLCNNEAGARREEYSFHAPDESWRVTREGLEVDCRGKHSFVELPLDGDGFAAEHEAFLSAVATGVEPPHALAALAPSLFLAELIESGHHGPVRLPARQAPRSSSRTTVLLVNSERQRGSLASMPSNWDLVSLDEVDRAEAARPDVRAAILPPGSAPLTVRILEKLPNLAVVGVIGLSLRRYDPDLLLDRGIALVNATHAYAESVAEFAFGLAILGRRRAFASMEAMRRGGWGAAVPERGARAAFVRLLRRLRPTAARLGIEQPLLRAWRSPPLATLVTPATAASRDLSGATVGLIGWGANAAAFSRRLSAAGARVLAYSDHASPEEVQACGAAAAPLANVLAADIVSLHRGLSPRTRHCLGAAEMAQLRPGAVLINVARGALIDTDALVARLCRRDIFACLDTFEDEPLPRRHPLRRMTNVFLTSHIAGGSPDMHAAAAGEVIAKVAAQLDGDQVEIVTAARLATMT
jgi:phosphoglycerate dehydrogenase-like enzyme/predicted dehydrogenase